MKTLLQMKYILFVGGNAAEYRSTEQGETKIFVGSGAAE